MLNASFVSFFVYPGGVHCTSSCRPVVSSRRCFATGMSTVRMVVITSPSFSSYRPCWLVSPLLLNIWGWLAAAFFCTVFSSNFASSRSQSFGSPCLPLAMLFSCLLALPAVGYALPPVVGSALFGSFHPFSPARR